MTSTCGTTFHRPVSRHITRAVWNSWVSWHSDPGSGAVDKEDDSGFSPWTWARAHRDPPCWHQSPPPGSSGWSYFCLQPHPWLHLKKQQVTASSLVWPLSKGTQSTHRSLERHKRPRLLQKSRQTLGMPAQREGPWASKHFLLPLSEDQLGT